MQPMLSGFVDELTKLAEDPGLKDAMREARREASKKNNRDEGWSVRRGGAPVSRNYLTSALLGAISVPLVGLAGKKIQRALHNRDVGKAIARASHLPEKRKALEAELQLGPLVGRARPDLPVNKRPAMTTSDIASDAAKGGLMGSVVQMVRDRFSGEGKKDKT